MISFRIFRFDWGAALLVAVVCLSLTLEAAAQNAPVVLKRRNVDNLGESELNAYMHALQILKDRSQANQFDFSGYTWQSDVHNTPQVTLPNGVFSYPGMCEHGSDLFFPWHRAQLYFFEQILQRTDPDGEHGPSTRNVTIPYWNWTRPPSGIRYPRVFEDSSLYPVLYHPGRNTQRVVVVPSYAQPSLIASFLRESNWNVFGGGKKQDGGGFGDFERQSHNPMHGEYIGGDMGDPNRAARDPIFYSFHCYIDLIYEGWLKRHGTANHTSGKFYLRGTQPVDIPRPPGYVEPQLGKDRVMGQVELYYDTRKVHYGYEVLPADRFLLERELASVLAPLRDRPVFGANSSSRATLLRDDGIEQPLSSPDLVRTANFAVPKAGTFKDVSVTLNVSDEAIRVSYRIDVFLHPSDEQFDPLDRKFRKRYLVESSVRWQGGHHHTEGSVQNVTVDLTKEIQSLSASQAGERWTVTFAITWLPLDESFENVDVEITPAAN